MKCQMLESLASMIMLQVAAVLDLPFWTSRVICKDIYKYKFHYDGQIANDASLMVSLNK